MQLELISNILYIVGQTATIKFTENQFQHLLFLCRNNTNGLMRTLTNSVNSGKECRIMGIVFLF